MLTNVYVFKTHSLKVVLMVNRISQFANYFNKVVNKSYHGFNKQHLKMVPTREGALLNLHYCHFNDLMLGCLVNVYPPLNRLNAVTKSVSDGHCTMRIRLSRISGHGAISLVSQ